MWSWIVKYKLVIFDFDGTLANSFPWVITIFDDLADRHKFKRINYSEIETLRGYNARQMIRHHRVPLWKMALIGRDLRKRMSNNIDQVPLFEGIDRLLSSLSAQGVRLAIVSSNSAENIRKVLGPKNAVLIDEYECGVSIFGKRSKFNKVLRKTGIPPSQAICIGDEIRDLQAARQARIPFGAVAWGFTRLDALMAHAPEEVFTSVEDLFTKMISPGLD